MNNIFKFLILTLAVLCLGSCAKKATNTPTEVVCAYYDAISEGNFAQAATYFNPEQVKTEKAIREMGEKLEITNTGDDQIPIIIKEYKILNEKYSDGGKKAIVEAEITSIIDGEENHRTAQFPLSLVDEKWVLNLM